MIFKGMGKRFKWSLITGQILYLLQNLIHTEKERIQPIFKTLSGHFHASLKVCTALLNSPKVFTTIIFYLLKPFPPMQRNVFGLIIF